MRGTGIGQRFAACVALAVVTAGPTTPRAFAQGTPVTLTLAQAVTLALQQNQQLRVAAFEVQIANAQLAQAKAGGGPTLNVQASYTRIKEQPPITFTFGMTTVTVPASSPDIYDSRLILSYPLYTGGRVDAQIALAEANLKGAEATFARFGQQIVFNVRQAYYQHLLAQAGVEVAERATAQATENLRVAKARVASGVAPRFDEIQAEVAAANARQGEVRARNALAQARQGLNGLLNLSLDTPLVLNEQVTVESLRTPLDRLLVAAAETRPEIAEVQARQAAAQAGIALAESGARPTVALNGFGSFGNGSGGFGGGSSSMSTNWGITLAVTLNLYDGGLTRERIHEAELRLEQLKALEVQQRQTIALEVRQALLNLQSAAEELAGADALITQAAEALRIANVRFQSGIGTSLEVISAQAAASQAEGSKAQALFSFNVARAALERAVGGPVQ
jgi:outer membrane protein TolC